MFVGHERQKRPDFQPWTFLRHPTFRIVLTELDSRIETAPKMHNLICVAEKRTRLLNH